MPQRSLTAEQCAAVTASLEQARAYARRWPTLADAQRAGLHIAGKYSPGWGTHVVNLGSFDAANTELDPDNPKVSGSAIDDQFDPAKPEFLQYSGDAPESVLVGVSWYVSTGDGQPPEGFPGDSDVWHNHEKLCTVPGSFQVLPVTENGTVKRDNASDEACAAAGGVNVNTSSFYMLHAWIVEGYEFKPDVFVNDHPCLAWPQPLGRTDSCWTDATRPARHHVD